MKPISATRLTDALVQLEAQLQRRNSPHLELIVCGGSALIATQLVQRTTKDVDILALFHQGILSDPNPFPTELIEAAKVVGVSMDLPMDWLNAGPADLFRMGVPAGLTQRLHSTVIGPNLTIHYIDRIDQIYFKLNASVDRGGYHIDDLLALHPTDLELEGASLWSMTHDVSEGYALMLRSLLEQLGFAHVAARI